MGKRVTMALFMLLLGACQSFSGTPTPIGPVTRPELVEMINWERLPLSVVFRAETLTADTESLGARNRIAACTIYGDNRIVYTAAGSSGFQVVWQRLSDEAIRVFVYELLTDYDFRAMGTGFDGSDSSPVLDTLLLIVNGEAHQSDSLANWPQGYYGDITERCRAVADSPAELIPLNAYISAETIAYDSNVPTTIWETSMGVDLSTLSIERRWMTDQSVQALWSLLRMYGADIQIRQGDETYHVAVEVPGVTRYSPLAPNAQ